MTFPRCTCNLTVTNRRVMYHGRTSSGRIVDSVPLDSVSAISSFYGKAVSRSHLIAGIILAIIGLVLMVMSDSSSSVVFGLLLLAGGEALVYYALQQKAFCLSIYTSNASSCPIVAGNIGGVFAIAKTVGFTLLAKPTEETDMMICELSAMITDLQSMGDYGVTRWKH